MLDCVIIFDFLLDGNLDVLHELALLVVDVIALVGNVLDLAEALLDAHMLGTGIRQACDPASAYYTTLGC